MLLYLFSSCFLSITVTAKSIDMNGTPRGAVNDGETVTLTCTTDTANPPAQIMWTRAENKFEQLTEQDIPSSNSGVITSRSVLTLQADRHLNNQAYQCCLKHSPQTCTDVWTMEVRCK